MITKRTVKIDEERYLQHIDDTTGLCVKEIQLDETQYNRESAEILIQGHIKNNPGVGYGDALVAVSVKHPELFQEYMKR